MPCVPGASYSPSTPPFLSRRIQPDPSFSEIDDFCNFVAAVQPQFAGQCLGPPGPGFASADQGVCGCVRLVLCVWAGPESVSWPATCHFGTSWVYRGEHPSLAHHVKPTFSPFPQAESTQICSPRKRKYFCALCGARACCLNQFRPVGQPIGGAVWGALCHTVAGGLWESLRAVRIITGEDSHRRPLLRGRVTNGGWTTTDGPLRRISGVRCRLMAAAMAQC